MIREGKILRFRCHTGHAFSSDTLLEAGSESIEACLWDAVRAVDETVLLLNRLGDEFARSGNTTAAEKCFDKAREAHERLAPVREAAIENELLQTQKLREETSG
jgi:two-component system chemotaxis response regulator CheB